MEIWRTLVRQGFLADLRIPGRFLRLNSLKYFTVPFLLFWEWQFFQWGFCLNIFAEFFWVFVHRKLKKFLKLDEALEKCLVFILVNSIWQVSSLNFLLSRLVQLVEVMGASNLFLAALSLSFLFWIVAFEAFVFVHGIDANIELGLGSINSFLATDASDVEVGVVLRDSWYVVVDT